MMSLWKMKMIILHDTGCRTIRLSLPGYSVIKCLLNSCSSNQSLNIRERVTSILVPHAAVVTLLDIFGALIETPDEI